MHESKTIKMSKHQRNQNLIKDITFQFVLLLLTLSLPVTGQDLMEKSVEGNVDNLPVREHTITIRAEKVSKAGKEVMGMTINGSIPGPTLRFKEGEYAMIYVKNELAEETSVHWHGLLLPNFYSLLKPSLNNPYAHSSIFTPLMRKL